MARTFVAVLAAAGLVAALAGRLWAADEPSSRPDVRAADVAAPGEVIATVNGKPIRRDSFAQLLIEAHGTQMLNFVTLLEMVKQKAAENQITVAKVDLDAEEAALMPENLKKLEPKERERSLDSMLSERGLTRVHWRLVIERSAYLRKLAMRAKIPPPNEKLLRQMFNRQHGRRVEIRAIEVETVAKAKEVEDRLARKERFELVAKDLSVNKKTAAVGGLMPLFDADDPKVPEEVRAVAFTLVQPGDRSGRINDRGRIHFLQLVKFHDPEKVAFEDVRDKLEAQVREVQIRLQMNVIMGALMADIEILDPVLQKQADQARDAGAKPDTTGVPEPADR